MNFWSIFCSCVEVAMLWGRIPDRRNQVWQKTWYDSRKEKFTETLLIIDLPFPLRDSTLDRLLSDTPVWLRGGWLHKVVELESGRQFDINEKWFGSWSEDALAKGDPGWKRVS